MKDIRIVLVDDHVILRDGLKSVFLSEQNISIVGECGDGETAITMARELEPDIIVLDLNLPQLNGLEAARAIRKFDKKCKILILTMSEDAKNITEALSAGVNGYLFKMAEMDELLEAIKQLASGKDYFSNPVKEILEKMERNDISTGNFPSQVHLTIREREIIRLITKGCTSHEIAQQLFISYFTVGKHRKNILRKLGLKNAAEIVGYAHREGLFPHLKDGDG
jgi:DNA-binding NarL/FixJ family response regulator